MFFFIYLHSDTERSQIAYVTFKDAQGAETAILLSVIQFFVLISFHFVLSSSHTKMTSYLLGMSKIH